MSRIVRGQTLSLKQKEFITLVWIAVPTIFVVFTSGNLIPLKSAWLFVSQVLIALALIGVSSFVYIHSVTWKKYDYNNRKRFEKLMR